MSSSTRPAGTASTPAGRSGSPEAAADVALTLVADRRAAYRARGEIHRVLRDVPPQRRVTVARLVGALLDGATPVSEQPKPVELRLWRAPGLVLVELRSASRLRVSDESRLMLRCVADGWELDPVRHSVRFAVRTDLSARSSGA